MRNQRNVFPCVFLSLVLASGCGGGSASGIRPGPMPQGGSYTGVWFSPQYGEMHVVQTGSSVVAEYTKDERTGRLQGTVQGDVLRFDWEESREMVAGRTVRTRGRGYFRYSIGEDGEHYILGEWGVDDRETGGGPWRAVKSRSRRPHLSTDSASGPASTDPDQEITNPTSRPESDEGSGGEDDLSDL